MSALERRILTSAERPTWDQALSSMPAADCSHDWRWGDLLNRVYGWTPIRAVWTMDGAPFAMLQAHVYPFGMPAVGIASPFLGTGGLALAEGAEKAAMYGQVNALAADRGLKRIELREADADEVSTEVTFRMPLAAREPLLARFPSKLRSQIRKSSKDGYRAEIVPGADPLFYPHFQRKMHEFGTPCHSRRFFTAWLEGMPDRMRQLAVFDPSGAVVGGMVLSVCGTVASVPYAAVYEPHVRSNANMLLYFEAMAHAADEGAQVFDFGRSHVDSGTYRFKSQWGGARLPLIKRICQKSGTHAAGYGELRSWKARAFTSTWARLPAFLADPAGPSLRRFIA